jgi:Domain of unknown function (DUF4349)/Putative zinc-finger
MQMSLSRHIVEPEKVMALLDGELSAVDGHAISEHVDHCSECARLAEHLRSTSHSLSRWQVPTIPTKLEDSITDRVTNTGSHHKIARANFSIESGFWNRKRWAIVSAGTVAGIVLFLTFSLPTLQRSQQTTIRERVYQQSQQTGREGSAGKPQVGGHAMIGQKSKVPLSRLVTQATPGIAADANGSFHGLGDHVENSFSVDGQPITDQQGKVFSNFTVPMIARTVSLSIVVKDFTASRSSLDAIVRRHHGYSAQLNVSTPEDAPRGLQASLRIPAPDLSATIGDLKTLGRIEGESQAGEEVTKQHTDLVARLKNARDTEQRFQAILQQHTGNVGEVLQVEEGITRVRGDIERMEAEQKALEHRVDFGTVELQLTEEYKAQLNPPAASVFTRIHNAFVAGYRNASETVLGILLFFAEYGPALLIWLMILVLPVIFVWRRFRKALATV